MNLQCPSRHVSYATWRLQVLCSLYLSPQTQQPQTALTTCTRAKSRGWKRHYSLFRSFGGSNVKEPSSPQDETLSDTATRARRSQTSKHRGPFNPYSQEDLQKLKDLLPELKAISERMRDRNRDYDSRPSLEKISIPESPIKAQVEKAAKRRGIQKERATYKELGPLQNNAWAEMLASPIRFCHASGSRLPGDFLVEFDYVKNPVDGKTYLLPSDLADLDALEEGMAKQLYKEDWRRVRDDKRAARAARDKPTSTSSTLRSDRDAIDSPPRPRSALSRILSDINIFRLLTLKFTSAKKNKPQLRLTKVGEVAKLVPYEAKAPFLNAQHYIRHRREIDLATGAPDVEKRERLPVNFRELQWQPDLYTRLPQIMRKRVLVCLKALAESTTERSVGKDQRRAVAIPLPRGEKLTSDDLHPFLAGTLESPSASTATEAAAATTPIISARQPAMSGKGFLLGHPHVPPGSIFLHVGDGDISSLLSQTTNPDTDNDARSSSSSSSSSSFSPLPMPPLPSYGLIPPMLSVDDTYRFPVFSLSQLLSHSQTSSSGETDTFPALDTLIQKTPAFQLNSPAALVNEKRNETDDNNYLILIRPGPGPAKQLVKEIWQLWRYLEGQLGASTSLDPDWSLEGEGEDHVNADRQEQDDAENDDDDDANAVAAVHKEKRRW